MKICIVSDSRDRADARLELGGRRIFVVHYNDYGYAMACTGDWTLVCCGHSHRAEAPAFKASISA